MHPSPSHAPPPWHWEGKPMIRREGKKQFKMTLLFVSMTVSNNHKKSQYIDRTITNATISWILNYIRLYVYMYVCMYPLLPKSHAQPPHGPTDARPRGQPQAPSCLEISWNTFWITVFCVFLAAQSAILQSACRLCAILGGDPIAGRGTKLL